MVCTTTQSSSNSRAQDTMTPLRLPSPALPIEPEFRPRTSALDKLRWNPLPYVALSQADIDGFVGNLRFRETSSPAMTLVQRRKGFQLELFETVPAFRFRKAPEVHETIAERRGCAMPLPKSLPNDKVPWELSGHSNPSPPLPNREHKAVASAWDPIPTRYQETFLPSAELGGGPGPTVDSANSSRRNALDPNAAAAVVSSVVSFVSTPTPLPLYESLQDRQVLLSSVSQPATQSIISSQSRNSQISSWLESVDTQDHLLARALSSSLDSVDLDELIDEYNVSGGLSSAFTVGSNDDCDTTGSSRSYVSVDSKGYPKQSPQPITWTVMTKSDEPCPAFRRRRGALGLPPNAVDHMAAFDLAEALADLSIEDKAPGVLPTTRDMGQGNQVSPSLILWTTDPSFFADPPVIAVKPKGRAPKPVWQDDFGWPDAWSEVPEMRKPRPRPAVKGWLSEPEVCASPAMMSPPRPRPATPAALAAEALSAILAFGARTFKMRGPRSPIIISPTPFGPGFQGRGHAPNAPISRKFFPLRGKSRATRGITLQNEITPLYTRLQVGGPTLEETMRAHLTASPSATSRPFCERLGEGKMTLEQAVMEHIAARPAREPISEIRIPGDGFGEIWSWLDFVEKARRVVSLFVVG